MGMSKDEALGIAGKVKAELEELYGPRLRGIYVYGSAAAGELTEESDIDIAVILDKVSDGYSEHERTRKLGSRISLEARRVVSFLFVSEADLEQGRFAVHRAIKAKGILA